MIFVGIIIGFVAGFSVALILFSTSEAISTQPVDRKKKENDNKENRVQFISPVTETERFQSAKTIDDLLDG